MNHRLAITSVLLLSSLLLNSCEDEDDRLSEERAARFTTATKPAPNPRREALETLVKPEYSAATGHSTTTKFELFSEYKGEDMRQVTGVSGRILLLFFSAPWCKYSEAMRSELKTVATEEKGNVQVIEINADAYPALAEEYKIGKVPTTIIYTEGVRLRNIYGLYNARSVRNYIRSVLAQSAQ